MNRIVRYIGAHVISAIFIVVVVISGIEFLITFLGQMSDIGQYDYGFLQAFYYVALQLPGQLYAVFPMVGFLGGLLALDKLSSSSELTIMRASGFSKTRITVAVMYASAVILVAVTLMGEVIAPYASKTADLIKNNALRLSLNNSKHGTWLKSGGRVINIGVTESPSRIDDVSVFDFRHDHLQQFMHANYGQLENGRWKLFDIKGLKFDEGKTKRYQFHSALLNLYYSASSSSQTKSSALNLSAVSLWQVIQYLHKVGLSSREFQFQFWVRVFRPFSILLMIALGVPFIFGSVRSSSRGARMALGVVVGFAFYMMNQIFGPVTLIFQFPPFLAAAAPIFLFLIVYIVMMKRTA